MSIAWKFVTQPKPVIVCEPKEYIAEQCTPYFGHWDKDQKGKQLICVRPVVFRTYEGLVMDKALVGNK